MRDANSLVHPADCRSSISDLDLSMTPLSPTKLKEMLPSVVNGFSPSNLKRTATTLMTEWEKSLVTPEDRDKENAM